MRKGWFGSEEKVSAQRSNISENSDEAKRKLEKVRQHEAQLANRQEAEVDDSEWNAKLSGDSKSNASEEKNADHGSSSGDGFSDDELAKNDSISESKAETGQKARRKTIVSMMGLRSTVNALTQPKNNNQQQSKKRRQAITGSTRVLSTFEKKYPEVAQLHAAFDYAEVASKVLSSLVLESSRFWVDLEDRPAAADEIWNPEIEHDTVYMNNLTEELDGDPEKIQSLFDFIEWDESTTKLFEKAEFFSLHNDDFLVAQKSRIRALCLLFNKFFSHYVQLLENNFSLLVIEKLRYIHREFLKLLEYKAIFQVEVNEFSQNDKDFDEEASIPAIGVLAEAMQKLSAMTMAMSFTALSGMKNLDKVREAKKPVKEFTLLEGSAFKDDTETIEELEERIALDETAAAEQKARIEALKAGDAGACDLVIEESQRQLEQSRERQQIVIQTVTTQIANLELALEESFKEVHSVRIQNSQGAKLLRDNLNKDGQFLSLKKKELPQLQKEMEGIGELLYYLGTDEGRESCLNSKIAQYERELESYQAKINQDRQQIETQTRLKFEREKASALNKKRNEALALAKKNEDETWEQHYSKAVHLTVEYATSHPDEALFPENVQLPSSEISLVAAISASDTEIKKYIIDQIEVSAPQCQLISHSISTESGLTAIYKDVDNAQVSTIMINSDYCSPTYVPTDSEEFDVVKRYRELQSITGEDLSKETDHALSQLETVNRANIEIEVQEDEEDTHRSTFSTLFGSVKPSVQSRYVREITPGEEFALLTLIYTPEISEHLLQALDELEMRYNLQASSLVSESMLPFEYQSLFFRFFNTKLDIDGEEKNFFTASQLAQMSQQNWMLRLLCLQEVVKGDCILNSLQALRAHAILKVLDNMMRHWNDLPQWAEDFFRKMDDVEQKNQFADMSDLVKRKLVFGLVIDFLHTVLMKIDGLAGVASILENIQTTYDFPILKQDNVTFNLAIYFLYSHSHELLQGTNFENKVIPKTEIGKTKEKEKTSALSFKSIRKSIFETVSSSSGKPVSQAIETNVVEPAAVEISDKVILLSIASSEQADRLLDNSIVGLLIKKNQEAQEAITIERNLLEKAFVDQYEENVQYFLYSEFEVSYSEAFDQYQKDMASQEAELLKLAGVRNTELANAIEMARVVGSILRELILNSERFVTNSFNLPERVTSKFRVDARDGIENWIKQVLNMSKTRNDVLSNLGASNVETRFSMQQLIQLIAFERMFLDISNFEQNSGVVEFLNRQNKSSIKKFVEAINQLAATAMMLSIIVLAVKKEMELAQMLMQESSSSTSSSKKSTVHSAWEDYAKGVEFFKEYVKSTASLRVLMLSEEVKFMLPATNPVLMEKWSRQVRSNDSSNIAEVLTLKLRALTVGVSKTGAIHLKAKDSSLYTLLVKPEQLHPSYTSAQDSFDELERGARSLIKICDAYQKKVGAATEVRSAGAMHVVKQLQAAQKKIACEHNLALEGLLLIFYFVTIEISFYKSEASSRMAQSIYEFGLYELGIDLRQRREIFQSWIRPTAYKSGASLSILTEAMKTEVFLVQLGLTMAVVHFYNAQSSIESLLTEHQLQFAIRGNGYLEMLNVRAIIRNFNIEIDSFLNRLFGIVDNLQRNIIDAHLQKNQGNIKGEDKKDFSTLFSNFCSQSKSTKIREQGPQLTSFQVVKIVFGCTAALYKEIFMALGNEALKDLFAHIEKTHFSCNESHEAIAYILGKDFLKSAGFLTNSGIAVDVEGGLSRNPAAFRRTVAGVSMYTNSNKIELIDSDIEAKKATLLGVPGVSGVSEFFKAVTVTREEAALITSVLSIER